MGAVAATARRPVARHNASAAESSQGEPAARRRQVQQVAHVDRQPKIGIVVTGISISSAPSTAQR